MYLSDRLLRQFAPTHESWWNRIRLKKLTGSVGASSTSIGFESERPTENLPISDLARVVNHIQESALWYSDDGVYPGGWIFFDAPMSRWVLGGPSTVGATIFFDVVPMGQQAFGRRRIFLQAATENLVGRPNSQAPPLQPDIQPGGGTLSIHAAIAESSDMEMWGSGQLMAIGLELDDLMSVQAGFNQALDRRNNRTAATSAIDWLINEVADDPYSVRQAGWMAGCARTLAVHYLPRSQCEVVVATPLYLERVPPPGVEFNRH